MQDPVARKLQRTIKPEEQRVSEPRAGVVTLAAGKGWGLSIHRPTYELEERRVVELSMPISVVFTRITVLPVVTCSCRQT